MLYICRSQIEEKWILKLYFTVTISKKASITFRQPQHRLGNGIHGQLTGSHASRRSEDSSDEGVEGKESCSVKHRNRQVGETFYHRNHRQFRNLFELRIAPFHINHSDVPSYMQILAKSENSFRNIIRWMSQMVNILS